MMRGSKLVQQEETKLNSFFGAKTETNLSDNPTPRKLRGFKLQEVGPLEILAWQLST